MQNALQWKLIEKEVHKRQDLTQKVFTLSDEVEHATHKPSIESPYDTS